MSVRMQGSFMKNNGAKLSAIWILAICLAGCPGFQSESKSDPIVGGWTNLDIGVGLRFLANGESLAYIPMSPEEAYENKVPEDVPLDKDIWIPHTRSTWKRAGQRIDMKTVQTVWTQGDQDDSLTIVHCDDNKLVIQLENDTIELVRSSELKLPDELMRENPAKQDK